MSTSQIYEAILNEWRKLNVPIDQSTSNDDKRFKVIAAFVGTDRYYPYQTPQVLSIGTGSKCASNENGQWKKNPGELVFDSHAEVVARRALVRLLYDEVTKANQQSRVYYDFTLLERNGSKYRLKSNLKLHLYINCVPCGSASQDYGTHQYNHLRVIQEASHAPKAKTEKERTKADLSYSCSDKIALWNAVGVQGALLSELVEPIFIDSIIISERFDTNSLRSAFYGRIQRNYPSVKSPEIVWHNKDMSTIYREFTQNFEPRSTSAASISHNWFKGSNGLELVDSQTGLLYNPKYRDNLNGSSRLSQKKLFQHYKVLMQQIKNILNFGKYWDEKKSARDYQQRKQSAMNAFENAGLGYWVRKPAFEFN